MGYIMLCFVFFKQKTAYEMRISDWSSDVCSSDLLEADLDGLKSALDRGKISAERYSDAVLRLWQNYLNAPPILDTPMVGLTTDEQSLEDLNKTILDRLPESLSKLASHAEATKVQVVKSFKDMADDTLSMSLKDRSEEHTSELQSLMRISYAVFCLKKKTIMNKQQP